MGVVVGGMSIGDPIRGSNDDSVLQSETDQFGVRFHIEFFQEPPSVSRNRIHAQG